MRCWKMYMLNHQDHEDVQLMLDGNLTRTLIANKEGLLAGGTTMADRMDCPNINQKLEEVCRKCHFSGPDDMFDI